MKSYRLKLSFAVCLLFISCTDVIEVEVPKAEPRLVIEASMDWEKGSEGNEQMIKLSLSTPYFDNLSETAVTGASVKVIKDNDQTEVVFIDQNDGTYTTDEFVAVMNQSYTLEVIYGNEVYMASGKITPVTKITALFQSKENGFDKNALEVNIEYIDPKDIKNFYLVKFQRRGDLLPALFDMKDEFTDGNLMTIFYEKLEDEDSGETEFQPGDIVDISLLGVSEQYYNYIRLLIAQSGGPGGPFTTIPGEIKGNCFNVSNPEKYPFGYFRLSEVDSRGFLFK